MDRIEVEESNRNFANRQKELGEPADVSYRLDKAECLAAKRFFGLKWPVSIRYDNRKGDYSELWGCHRVRYKDGKPYHKITIKRYLSPEVASAVLWHELTHAMQAEELGDKVFHKLYHSYSGSSFSQNYLNNPFEVEARDHEKLAEEYPLYW